MARKSSISRLHVIETRPRRAQQHQKTPGTLMTPISVVLGPQEYYIRYLYSSFLARHSITGHLSSEYLYIKALLLYSPAVHDAALAVSALCALRHGGIRGSALAQTAPFEYYRSAVSSVRAQLTCSTALESTSLLWSTFFLTLFELSYDGSGAGFVSHFFHGTSQLLQRRGPDRHRTGAGRRFFIVARVVEVCRALIYSSETFLAHQDWQDVTACMWNGPHIIEWHPKEALYDLMIRCVALAMQ